MSLLLVTTHHNRLIQNRTRRPIRHQTHHLKLRNNAYPEDRCQTCILQVMDSYLLEDFEYIFL